MQVTTRLHTEAPDLTRTFGQVVASSKSSPAGFHANSTWLTCPEQSRLKSIGLKRKNDFIGSSDELNALDFGTLIHELCRIRAYYTGGHELMLTVLEGWRHEIGETSYMKALLQMAALQAQFPLETEPLIFYGVESEVITDLRNGTNDPRPCLRSVRYDAVVGAYGFSKEHVKVYSLERKTAARSGGLNAYYGQGMTQVVIWNSNPELVRQYGRMEGIIFEQHIKTKVPSCERHIFYVSQSMEKMALEYMRYSSNGTVQFQMQPDGTYPKMLHACWGRYRPCDFISICHEGVTGDYTLNGEEIKRGDIPGF